MEGLALWGLGAGALAIVAAAWRHIRAAWNYVLSFAIVSFEAHETSGEALAAYCFGHGRQSRFGLLTYVGWRTFVRPRNRREGVVLEVIGRTTRIIWIGRRPLAVTRASSTGNADRDQQMIVTRPLKVSFIRGTFTAAQLMLDAMDYYNERDRYRGGSRYGIRYLSGTSGKPATLQPSGQPPEGRSDGPLADDGVMRGQLLRWSPFDIGPHRSDGNSLETLAMTADMSRMVRAVSRWLDSRQWFQEHGVPWKQGWLLYGVPGTGKTAMVRAIAEAFDLPVFVFDLGTFYNDEFKRAWHKTLSETPCIALFEDTDTVFRGRETQRGDLGFDCVLNCLDGVERSDGVLTIVTTNCIDALDPALGGPSASGEPAPRPGRIDHVIEMQPLDRDGRLHLCRRILCDWPDMWPEIVAAGTGDTGARFQARCVQRAMELYVERETVSA